jgi:hypothetical protein
VQVSDDKFEEEAARNGVHSRTFAPFLVCFHVLVVKFAAFSELLPTFCLVFRLFNRAFHKISLLSCGYCWQVGSSRMEGKSYSR